MPELIESARKLADELGLSKSEKGALSGFAAGLKTGFSLIESGREQGERLAEFFKSRGINLAQIGEHLWYSPQMLAKRAEEEPRLAEHFGWDTELDAEINVHRILGRGDKSAAFEGFIYGFPASAIYGYERMRDFRARGIPMIYDIAYPHGRKEEEKFGFEKWDHKDTARLRELRARWDTDWRHREMDHYERMERFERELAPFAREMLKKYYGAGKRDELDFISRREFVSIKTPEGEPVFEFAVYGPRWKEAPDVASLKKKAEAAFSA